MIPSLQQSLHEFPLLHTDSIELTNNTALQPQPYVLTLYDGITMVSLLCLFCCLLRSFVTPCRKGKIAT